MEPAMTPNETQDSRYRQLAYGALLHDIGKPLFRTREYRGDHSAIGAQFALEHGLGDEVRDCIAYHHAKELRRARLPVDSLAYLVYEADNLASAADRRPSSGDERGFGRYLPLQDIFNLFKPGLGNAELVQPLQTKFSGDAAKINLPLTPQQVNLSAERYGYIAKDFINGFKRLDHRLDSLDSLLKLLELTTGTVPSSTERKEVADISLYNHVKLTAMLAGCMLYYFKERGITDYRRACFTKPLRNEEIYLFVSGKLSGIQNFLYEVPSKGALKSLRGRSFFLEVLVEHILDEILGAAGLCRANLLYAGGGRFYLVLPNTAAAELILKQIKETVNDWLIASYALNAGFELTAVAASGEQLINSAAAGVNELGELFSRSSGQIARDKLRRYSPQQLRRLCTPRGGDDDGRECCVCGATAALEPYGDSLFICPYCGAMFELGDALLRLRADKLLFAGQLKGGLPLPSLRERGAGLALVDYDEAERLLKQPRQQARVYTVNDLRSGQSLSTNLWAGTYTAPGSEGGLVTFAELAERSQGIKRLGVLRADVDNLGDAFKTSFLNPEVTPEYCYLTLSRQAELSYRLSLFFKHEINALCSGGMTPRFALDNRPKTEPRQVSIVYSGGDDLFIVGAWNEVVELAVDLRRALQSYTQGKISLSAGIGMFRPGYPVSRMASFTGTLEKAAKQGSKNQIALFQEDQVYSWDSFADAVIAQKLHPMLSWFKTLAEEEKGKAKEERDARSLLGTSMVYKLLALLRGAEEAPPPAEAGIAPSLEATTPSLYHRRGRINLARLSYQIARLKPSATAPREMQENYRDFRELFFSWSLKEEERRQLITALTLFVYLNRKDEA